MSVLGTILYEFIKYLFLNVFKCCLMFLRFSIICFNYYILRMFKYFYSKNYELTQHFSGRFLFHFLHEAQVNDLTLGTRLLFATKKEVILHFKQ